MRQRFAGTHCTMMTQCLARGEAVEGENTRKAQRDVALHMPPEDDDRNLTSPPVIILL